MKTIIIFFVMMVTFKDIYAARLQHHYPEENTTPIECNPCFNGTIKCFKSGEIRHTLYCTINCTSNDWTYFYLTNTHWYNIKPIKMYVSPMMPTENSTLMKSLTCEDGYNATKVCFSSDVNLKMSLICQVTCTSATDSYIYESDMLLNDKKQKYYESTHIISSNPERWPLEKRRLH